MGTLIIQPKSWDFSNINTALWVTAADGSTVINTSGAIDQLSDKSGNNTHLTASGVNRPTYLTNTLNGKPVISFDGVNDSLQTNAWGLTGYTGLSIFLVAKWQTFQGVFNNFNQLQVLVDNAHNAGSGFVIQDRPDLIGKPTTFATPPVSGGNANGVLDTTEAGNNTWQMIGATRTLGVNGKHSFYRNGQLISESGNTANLTIIDTRLALGCWANGNTRFLNGQIAEVIITKYPFDTDTVSKAFGRLAHNWGLTANLPSNHPYKNTSP